MMISHLPCTTLPGLCRKSMQRQKKKKKRKEKSTLLRSALYRLRHLIHDSPIISCKCWTGDDVRDTLDNSFIRQFLERRVHVGQHRFLKPELALSLLQGRAAQ